MSSLTAIRLRKLLFCFLPVLLLSSAASGQVDSVKDDTSTPVPGVGHDYIKSLVETVSPMNGSLTFRISAPMPPGRGITVPFSVNYDSNGSLKITNPVPGGHDFAINQVTGIANGGWSYSVPTLSVGKTTGTAPGEPQDITCDFWINYLYQDAGGGRHSLGLSTYSQDPKSKGNQGDCSQSYTPWGPATIVSASSVSYGADGSIYAILNSSTPLPVTVTQPDGTTAYFSSSFTPPMTYVASSVTDRNGNLVTINGSGITYTDTLGRTALSTSGTFGGSGAGYVSVSGVSGSYQLNWSAITWNYDINLVGVTSSDETGTLDNNSSQLGTIYAVSSIALPNGQSFGLQYDPTYGMVSKLTYPSGGYVRYVWGINAQSEEQEWDLATFQGHNCSPTCAVNSYYDTPAVTDRYVSYDGTTEVLRQHFAYTTTWTPGTTNWTTKTTTVTTYDYLTGVDSITIYTYTPNCIPVQPNTTALQCTLMPVESTVVYQDGNGHTLQTVNKAWANPRELVCQQTVLDNGLTSETDWGYNVYEQETEKDEYDYGSGATSCAGGGSGGGWSKPGPLYRKTVTNYATFSNLYLVDRPSSVVICNTSATCSSGSSNSVSETDYSYDQTTPTATSTIQHTSAPGGTQRGNLTTKSEHVFTTSPGSYTLLNTTYVNDDTGQRLSMTDPNGNTISYSYTDNYYSGTGTPPGNANTNAFLTQIAYPYTHGPNTSGTNHIEKFSYGYTNGQLYQSIDQNSQSTLYKYADAFARPTEIDYPDGGQTLFFYNDAPPTPTVTTWKKMNNSPTYLKTVSVMNGLGMGTQGQLTSDTEGADYTDTTFDGQKHAWKQSNPHRSGSSNTDGTTTSTYDALGRVTLITSQDGSHTSTSYSGNCTTVTDPASKTRESCSDAMGRLTKVLEDPFGADYETDYSYNALDKLTQVVQAGSHTRTFTYDSLARLMSAYNPETGTITYNYDSDSNCGSPNLFMGLLVSQVDARGVRTCMQYDQDNRLTYKSHSDGTYYVYYEYDWTTVGCWTISNGIGRLTVSLVGQNATHLMSYDPMGRIVLNAEGAYYNVPNNNGQTNSAYNVNYVYDLIGDILSVSSGVGGATNNNGNYAYYTYDGAARPISVTGSLVDSNHPSTLASVQSHWPTGAIQKMTYGNGLTETRAYDNRLQPCRVNVNSSGTTLQNCSAGTPSGNVLDLTAGFNYGSGDNGNVVSWTAAGHQSFSRSYTYDSLNRLQTYSGPSDPSGCYGLTWSYDAWGNRNAQSLTNQNSGSCSAPQTPADGNNHMISPYVYDGAGNLLYDGTNTYAYDADERISTVNGGPSNGGTSYLYNGEDMRVSRTVASVSTDFIRGFDAKIYSDNLGPGWSNWANNYIYLGDQLIAQYTGGPSGATQFVHADHLGSTRLVTNLSGSVIECDDYLPYGELLSYGGTVPCNNTQSTTHKFTSKERDTESNLDYFGARYYTSTLGRFVTSDWALTPEAVPYADYTDPQSLNLYGYVRNNPLGHADADGHCYPVCTVLAGAAIGGAIGGGGEILSSVLHGQSINWRNVEGSAAKGALTGAAIGLAGPEAGVATTAAFSAGGNLLGGIADRTIQQQSATEILNPKEMAKDAVVGAVGGALGVKAEAGGEALAKGAGEVADASGDGATAAFYNNHAAAIGTGVGKAADLAVATAESHSNSKQYGPQPQQQQQPQQHQPWKPQERQQDDQQNDN